MADASTIRLLVVGGLAALVATATFGLERDAEGSAAPRAAEVLEMNIAEYERRYEGPYDLLIGSRLAAAYATRFSASGDPADLDRALELTTELTETWPAKPEIRNRLASLYITAHRFDDAFRLASETVKADSTEQGALAVLFDAAMAMGAYEVAGSALADLDADSFGRHVREARWLDARGENREARRRMRKACERIEDTAASRLVVAWCFTRMADLTSGAAVPAWHQRALAAWPDYRGVREARADAAYAEGRWNDARELYMTLRSDAHPDIYLRLAEVAAMRGDGSAARTWNDRFISTAGAATVEPRFAQSLAVYLARHGRAADAVTVMQRELDRRPSIETHALLAWTLLEDGRPAAALAQAGRAAAWGEPSAEARFLQARALEELGRTDEAATVRAASTAEPASLPHHLQLVLRAGR